MKKNILYRILFASAAIAAVSACSLKEEEDVFDKSASARTQELQANLEKILVGSEYGWVMHFYPHDTGQDYCFGGYEYTAVFNDGEVTIGSERNGTTTATSYYNVLQSDGATLSFDTYNTVLHYWSTPASGLYEGRGGDTDFIIQTASADKVVLVGKRWLERMELEPLKEDAADYLTKVRAAKKAYTIAGVITLGDVIYDYKVYQTTATAHHREFTYGYEDENGEYIEEMVPFTVCPEYIHLQKPVTIGEYTFQDLTVDAAAYDIKAVGADAVVFGHPRTWQSIDDIIGDYTLTYNREDATDEEFDTLDVSIKKSDTDGVLLLSGLNDNWDISMVYDDWTGILRINIQTLTQYTSGSTSKYLRFCFATYARALNSEGVENENLSTSYFRYQLSSIYYTRTYDELVWDSDKTYYVDAYQYSTTYPNTAWYLEGFSSNSGTATTGREQPKAETGLRFPNGSLYLPYVYSLTKK